MTAAHGTYSCYSHGCRCDDCRDAKNDYQRELRARRYTTAKPPGTPGRPRYKTPTPPSVLQRWKDKFK